MGRKIRPMVRTREEVADERLTTVYYVLYLDTDDNQYHVYYRSVNARDVIKFLHEQFGFIDILSIDRPLTISECSARGMSRENSKPFCERR